MLTEYITGTEAMLIYGLLSHYLKKMSEAVISDEKVTPVKYWSRNPYQTLLCAIGAVVGYAALIETHQLTGLTAFGVGYMSNSIADIIGARTARKLEDT